MSILNVIEFLTNNGGITSANELKANYEAAKKSKDFTDMIEVLDHASELYSLYK